MQCLDRDNYKGCGVGWLLLTALKPCRRMIQAQGGLLPTQGIPSKPESLWQLWRRLSTPEASGQILLRNQDQDQTVMGAELNTKIWDGSSLDRRVLNIQPSSSNPLPLARQQSHLPWRSHRNTPKAGIRWCLFSSRSSITPLITSRLILRSAQPNRGHSGIN